MAGRQSIAFEARRTRRRLAIARLARRSGPCPTDPVLVVSAGRTGSQLLSEYLNSLPGVTVRDEILNPTKLAGLPPRVTSRGVDRHLRDSIASLPGPVRGAKLLFSQLEERHLDPDALRRLFPDLRFVVLYRRSLAEQYVSLRLANATGQYANRGEAVASPARLHIDAADLRRFYDRVKARYRAFLAPPWVPSRSAIVCYEELVADPEGVLSRSLCPFLAVAPAEVTTDLRKQNARPLADSVSNFDEVAALLTGPGSLHDYP